MAFLKQTEFCLGRFFQTQPKLIGNPVLVARGQGTFEKKHCWANVLLGKSAAPVRRPLCKPRWGIGAMPFLEAAPESEGWFPKLTCCLLSPQTIESNWRCGRHNLQRIQCRSENSKGVYCLQYDDEKIISGLRDNSIKVMGHPMCTIVRGAVTC